MKDAIRKEILSIRKSKTPEEISTASKMVLDNLITSGLLDHCMNLMIYLDFNNEVHTDPIIRHCLEQGKRIFVPVCVPETRELVISEIHDLDDVITGHYNIREPKKEKLRLMDRNILDLVLVPGAAFDRQGNRLGYGAGYYDKFFSYFDMHHRVKKAALAFSYQVVDRVEADIHDVPMDYVITENEIICCKG